MVMVVMMVRSLMVVVMRQVVAILVGSRCAANRVQGR
jgi:hypothetical protein